MPEVSSVQFSIGKVFDVNKIDAGLAILLSPDNHVVEIPSSMLPDRVVVGSIVNVTIERNKEEESRELQEFQALQTEIYQTFSQPPVTPQISVKKTTQTSIIIKWNPLVLNSATFRGIDVYRNGIKLGLKPTQLSTQVKLTGLSVGRIGASYSDDLTSENTHLVCSLPKGPKYEKALELNIPIVTPEFLKSCEQLGKVQPAGTFYISKSSF
ncbi:Chitin synthase, class 5 [Boothiomyces macroporosus]|uniref:Chitin synthase, class 5 n=1 Tax=Boothiomyces macroporosus TaxID=261099 RepID=A0AAD5UH12_9FUNG|nr:Chitin synthase, class 5 [Boothiomyces macroporosus]